MQFIRFSHAAAAVLALALAVPALAQDATETAPATDAPVTAPAPESSVLPEQPNIEVTKQGDWEIGCLVGTTNCEMQQVAKDQQGNPVILVRIVRLPEGAEALALAVFNTPLGTLLPPGIGFQIDTSEPASLPFEWCVQEGCIVRLGLREPDVAALKRGKEVKLQVASIAEPNTAVQLTLSLAGFTAGYDTLQVPEGEPQIQPQQ